MDIPQNAVTRLRVMTRKSRFGFGKYADLTVQDAMIVNRSYVPFVYYNIESISFSDDILDELKLIRIEKPGKGKREWFDYQRAVSAEFTLEQRQHGAFKKERIRRSMARAQKARTDGEVYESRGKMQTRNQGK